MGLGLEFFQFDTCAYPKDERIILYELPKIVEQSYAEAVKCEKAKAYIACTVMVGRALEAVCKDFVPETKTIHHGLKKMNENGFVSEEILEWANELKYLRNHGAHASNIEISDKDSKDALDFLQAILEILYHLRPRFNDIKNRHSK
ncbi:DUF4145 domain-containing protein [Fusibacter sp. 3D3]|uniref:DUF4145 domain-containing protein n=1 Tax=Fusibacter sp. 3D3 TaxID=1048380 RepID=UPI000853CC98|nr:DUF4145 domain-containing protein [Fusibacter sp. 3D3]GAU80103.1 hypothetical protein F3D3_4769 [Fusibacter sp. 3D3]